MTISNQKPFVFSVSVFCSQIFKVKLNLRPNKYSLFFFAEFKLLMFHNNIVKISEKIGQAEVVENLPPSYLHFRFLQNLNSFLLYEKVEVFDFLKSNE